MIAKAVMTIVMVTCPNMASESKSKVSPPFGPSGKGNLQLAFSKMRIATHHHLYWSWLLRLKIVASGGDSKILNRIFRCCVFLAK
jgi:hypothetical protein